MHSAWFCDLFELTEQFFVSELCGDQFIRASLH